MSSNRARGFLDLCKANIVLVVFVVSIVAIAASISVSYSHTTFNSDDVAIQNAMLTWKPLSHMAFYGDKDVGFVLQAPIYYLVSLFILPGRTAMLASAILLAILNFSGVYWSSVYLLKSLKINLDLVTLTPFLWLSTFGYALSRLFVSTNAHNLVTGMIFILIALISKYSRFDINIRDPKHITTAIIYSLLIGLAIVNDRYFIYFGLVPALFFTGALLYKKLSSRSNAIIIASVLFLGYFMSVVARLILSAVGVRLLPGVGSAHLSPLGEMPHMVVNALKNILILVGGYEAFGDFGIWNFITLANQMLLVGGICWALYSLKRWQTAPQPAIIAFITIIALGAYAFSDFNKGVLQTYRYLVIVPYTLTFLLVVLIASNTRIRLIARLVISLAIFINIVVGIPYAQRVFHDPASKIAAVENQNENYELLEVLRENHIVKGYSEYWSSHINTYLSAGKIQLLPVRCNGTGTTEPFLWFVDSANYTTKTDKTAYIFHRDEPQCDVAQISQQFGAPLQIITQGKYTIYIYPYDLITRMRLVT